MGEGTIEKTDFVKTIFSTISTVLKVICRLWKRIHAVLRIDENINSTTSWYNLNNASEQLLLYLLLGA